MAFKVLYCFSLQSNLSFLNLVLSSMIGHCHILQDPKQDLRRLGSDLLNPKFGNQKSALL